MTEIGIKPEQVRQVANKFEQASNQSQEIVSSLKTTLSNLQPEWRGTASQNFYQEFEAAQKNMTQFVDLLNQIGQKLRVIAERFEHADNQ